MNSGAAQKNPAASPRISILIFFSGFALYLFSSAPALAPYRDMGEMVSCSSTLGIAHPPGYPTYTLLGKISTLFPLSNQSYRVNLLAVLGGALSGLFCYLLLVRQGISQVLSGLISALYLSSKGVWTVAIVTEMYSLNLAGAFFLLYLWSRDDTPRSLLLISFLAGVFCGIRMDIVLVVPSFFLGSFLLHRGKAGWIELQKLLGTAVLFFAFGFSIYLFLMVRSSARPVLNWNRPESISKLWGSITRKTHGGTLDLISENYSPGELFPDDIKIYAKDIAKQFSWAGLGLAFLGFAWLAKKNPVFFAVTFLGWLLCGPFFIYKANMPPNPYALAILEAHFLLPNVFTIIWIAFGLDAAFKFLSDKGEGVGRVLLSFLLAILILANIVFNWSRVSKRANYTGVDYAGNLFRTLPPDSIVVMKEDCQLFLCWALHYSERLRKDVSVVARGLSGSPWYIQMQKDEGVSVTLGPLRSDDDFREFIEKNSPKKIYAGWDQDVPYSPKYQQIPMGLTRYLCFSSSSSPSSSPDFLRELYVYRGGCSYQDQKDFFSSNILDDYSRAYFAKATYGSWSKPYLEGSLRDWDGAISVNSENPSAYYRKAFVYYQLGRMDRAVLDFERADKLYEKTMGWTRKYHTLPEAAQGIRNEWADCLLNLGVAWEGLGRKDKSEEVYLKALDVQPNLPRAHYNLAVIYWNRDWRKVAGHLQSAVNMDPGNPQYRIFLEKALYALKMSGG